MNSYKTGLISEFIARIYLRLHGFRILRRRYVTGRFTGRAEIDIIAQKKNLIAFIEVKHRPDTITGLAAVTGSQAARLRRAAETYIAQTGWRGGGRFDIIVIAGGKIQWIRGAI